MAVKRIVKCKGCGNRIDPEWCHCGDAVDQHFESTGHSPVPMGCTCGYVKKPGIFPKVVKLVRHGYSRQVRERLDESRPKYSTAVKSFAAFAPNVQTLEVLLSHLDAACEERRLEGVVDGARPAVVPDGVVLRGYSDKVKKMAYRIDPECWVSYSGKPRAYKQMMEVRRVASLSRASRMPLDDDVPL